MPAHMGRRDKEVTDPHELAKPPREAAYVTLALSRDNEPCIATLSHGYDEKARRIHFHCAGEGKKLDTLRAGPVAWGQAPIDGSYRQGGRDHLYKTTRLMGVVSLMEGYEEKRRTLETMVRRLDDPRRDHGEAAEA